MKTVRFSEVVKRAGQPHVHTLWVAPEKDAEFSRAVKSLRVMTVHQSEPGKAPFGTIGFDSNLKNGGQFLIFPKPLQRFTGSRVVGIKFDLVEQPKFVAMTREQVETPPTTSRRHRHKPPERAKIAPPAKRTDPPKAEPAPSHVEEERASPVAPPASRLPRAAPPRKRSNASDSALIREIRAALKDLERGNPVAAYRRLQRAIEGG